MRALVISQGLFMKMYDSLSVLTNVTSDSIRVYLKLFSVTDANQQRWVRSKMSYILKPNIRHALNQNTSGSSHSIFGGDSNVFKNLEDSKKMSSLLKSVLLQTKKPEKVGNKSGMKGAKKAAARGSKGKGKKNLKKKSIIAAKTNSNNSKGKEDSKEKGKKSDDPCKLVTPESITFSHPSRHGLCGCRASMDNTVSSISQSAFLPVSFPLQSAVENVSAIGLQPETIVSRLLLKLGGRLAHSEDSYWKIGTVRVALILSGMATNLPGSRVPLGRGLRLTTIF